ncbi:unnamed protein product [Trichobilharzia regenti]|nr:unnamed protein product [Trichobilharzia regenti]
MLNHQKSQSQQQLLLLDKSNSLKSSDNHNKYTTNISSSNSSNNNNTQLSDKLPRYNNQQHQLQRYQSDSSSENPTEVINIAPTISGISSTENGTSTITSITTTATTSIQVSSNRNSYAPRVVPPLIGINEIHTTNENDSNSTSELLDDKNTRYLSHSYRNQCSKNTLLNHHDIVSDYNSDHNNEFNDNNVDDADDRDDDAADENVYSDHFHIGWNDSIQSKIWLPKVAMNSNRLKLDEVMSTDWNLLTTKNWKSEQEIKKKMNRHINNNNNSNNTNNIKNKGVSWFRERSSNIKPLNYITRRQSDRQNEMKQSKGIKINSLMNHTSIRHNQHSSASNHKSQYDPVSEPVDIFSLPTVKVKYPNDDSLTTSMTNSNYNNKLTNKYKVNKSSLQFAYITTTDDEANKRTKVKTRQINNDSNRNTTINSHSNNNNNNNNRNNNNDRKKDTYPVSTDSDTSVLGYVDLTTATTTTTTTTVTTTVNNKVLSKECQNANKTDKPPTVTLSTRGSSQNLPNHTATHLDGPSSARQRHHQSQQHHQQQQPQPPPLPQKQQQTRVPDGDDDANAVAVQAKNSDHENKPSELITPSRTVHNLTSGNQNEKSREKSILIEQQKINQLEFRKMSTLPDNDYDNDDRDRDGLKSNGKMTIPMTPHSKYRENRGDEDSQATPTTATTTDKNQYK